MSQIDQRDVLQASATMLAGLLILIAVAFTLQPQSITFTFLGEEHTADSQQITVIMLVALGMVLFPFSASAFFAVLGYRDSSIAVGAGGFIVMITAGIILIFVLIEELWKMPNTFRLLFIAPYVVGLIAMIIFLIRIRRGTPL